MEIEYIRDYVMYMAVFGMFSFAWFGWAQENPPKNWRKYIGIASGISLMICLIGVYLSINNWDEATTLSDDNIFNKYLMIFYTEIFIAGLGSFLLIWQKKQNYVAPWITFIVGAHFISLVNVFKDPSLYILAFLLIAIAILSPYISKKTDIAPSAITGIGSGTILLCFALLGFIRYL